MRLQPQVRAVAASSTCGCSLKHMRLQPQVHAVAASSTCGCRLWYLRLQEAARLERQAAASGGVAGTLGALTYFHTYDLLALLLRKYTLAHTLRYTWARTYTTDSLRRPHCHRRSCALRHVLLLTRTDPLRRRHRRIPYVRHGLRRGRCGAVAVEGAAGLRAGDASQVSE